MSDSGVVGGWQSSALFAAFVIGGVVPISVPFVMPAAFYPQPKYRVLCLHGMGTNSEILELQTAALRYRLGDDYDYEFVDGQYSWPPATGIEEAFGQHHDYYSYYDGSARSAIEAVDDLTEYIEENGPFHVLIGFSLGAGLAATLLLRENLRRSKSSSQDLTHQRNLGFKCAIFICGLQPLSWRDLDKGVITPLQAEASDEIIDIPTVHAWSPNDLEFSKESTNLAQLCKASKRKEVVHGAGHNVPSQRENVSVLVDAIQEVMAANG